MIEFKHHTGGREKYFKAEKVGDCVIRAIAIASGKDYKEIYDQLQRLQKNYALTRNNKTAQSMRRRSTHSVRAGVWKKVYHDYLLNNGFTWVPTMQIGQGCTVHLRADELPEGTLIVRLSRHLACVKDGVLYDTYDCSRGGTRCVYGYYLKQ